MNILDSLEEQLNIKFHDGELLRLAFVHSSYLNENPGALPEPNERLEYLGDALLDLVVAQDLYERYPARQEGELTSLRSALVRGETLAKVARRLGLGDYLLMGVGEEASGGRGRESNLAAAFEAFLGALFLDKGYDESREFVLDVMSDELATVDGHRAVKNPKSTLQEVVQGRGQSAPFYRIVDATGKDHDRIFTAEVLVDGSVLGQGKGRRKSLAERDAASAALQDIEGDS